MCLTERGALSVGEMDHERILDELEEAGVYPYGSEQVRTHENRLIKAISWLYRKAEKSRGDFESLGASTREGAMAEQTRDLMQSHYDQPLEFFSHFLDSRYMAYSMAYFGDTSEEAKTSRRTLEEAQESKFGLMCERTQIRGDEKLFNIGCGFGSLETYLLTKHPQMRIVGITPSKVQSGYLRERMKNPLDPLGEGRFTLIEGDFSQVPLAELGAESFDMIFSVGTLEHFKNMLAAFERMAALLKPQGRAFHHIVSSRYVIPRYSDSNKSRLRHYFPGARVFPYDELASHTDYFDLKGSWFLNGMNYWRTLDDWHRRFWGDMDTVYFQLLGKEGVRYWNDYFSISKAMFAPMEGSVLGNGQYLFQKKSV